MIGSVSTSRRAIAFAQALDEQELNEGAAADEAPPEPGGSSCAEGAGGGGSAPARPPSGRSAAGSAEQSLTALAEGLEALPRPELDPEVKIVQRAQLIAAMEAAFASGEAAAGDPFPEQRTRAGARGSGRGGAHRAQGLGGPLSKLRPKSRLGKGLAAGGLGVGVAASALGGAAAASTDALPGDTLYGLKRGMEDLQLDMAGDDADKGTVFLDHASTRMQEARRLLEHRRSGELDHEALSEVRRTLAGMKNDASEGHRLLSSAFERDGDIGRIQSLSSFSKNHRAGWAKIRERLPVQLTDVGDEVSSVFDAIDSDVTPLRALFPKEPQEATPDGRPGTGERSERKHAPSEPAPRSTEGEEGRTSGDSGAPSPSDSQEDEREGLLGGTDLLQPSQQPKHGDGKSSGSGDSADPGDPSAPDGSKPDITLPPIVPDVLPKLGLGEGDR